MEIFGFPALSELPVNSTHFSVFMNRMSDSIWESVANGDASQPYAGQPDEKVQGGHHAVSVTSA
jgi:hypothetical protein